ncbi:MAG: hypothetical protein V1723_00315 [Candidatus Uhrbacteria bacterium]
MRTLFGLTALLGFWLIISPFVLGYVGIGRGNALLVGFFALIIGLMGVAGTIRR